MSDEPAIEIRDLTVAFRGRTVLHGVNLAVPSGGITVIIGPSGSGKTTLLRAINRLNECFTGCVTTGCVSLAFGGRRADVYRGECPLPELRRRAAMVFQSPNVLPTSIERNFTIPLRAVLGCSRDEARGRMTRALQEALLYDEVKDRLGDPALTLSGGQQQRLCLARALALEPTILLLDEPTASLDFRATRRIEDLLRRLQERYTVVAVSHSLGQTRRIADHVAVLREGRIAQTFDRSALADAALFQALVEEVF